MSRRRPLADRARDHHRTTSSGCGGCSPGSRPTASTAGSSPRSRSPPAPPCCGSRASTTTSRDALVALDGDEIVAVARYDGRAGKDHGRDRRDGGGRLAAPGRRQAPHQAPRPSARSTTASSRSRRWCSPTTAPRSGCCASSHPTRRCASTAASTRLNAASTAGLDAPITHARTSGRPDCGRGDVVRA